jgi:hypothetical protein
MEGFGEAAFGIALDSAEPQQSLEHAGIKPRLFPLRGKVRQQVLDFLASDGFGKRDKKVRGAEIAFVFCDFVFENQVIAKGVPSQLSKQAMILVQIFAAMSEDQIGLHFVLQLDEAFFDFGADKWKTSVTKSVLDNVGFRGQLQHGLGARFCFGSSRIVSAEDDPMDFQIAVFGQQRKQSTRAADFNIVTMCAEAQNGAQFFEIGLEHVIGGAPAG